MLDFLISISVYYQDINIFAKKVTIFYSPEDEFSEAPEGPESSPPFEESAEGPMMDSGSKYFLIVNEF